MLSGPLVLEQMWPILGGRARQVSYKIHASRHMRRGSTPGKKGTLIPRALIKRMVQRRAQSADKPQVFLTHARHARLRVDDVAVVELAGRQLKMAAAHTLGVSFPTIRWDTRGSRHAIA